MLTIHHLGRSQSERIIWLCEELGLPYELRRYERDPLLAPPALKALHPMGGAPVVTDGDLVLGESGAIVQYVVAKHGDGRLALGPGHPAFAQYLYWFHFANGTLQPSMGRNLVLSWLDLPPDNPILLAQKGRLHRVLGHIDERLRDTEYLAGQEFTAADIMVVFSLTTMRNFLPVELAPYPGILSYLQRIGARDAYQRAMRKGDPDMTPLLT